MEIKQIPTSELTPYINNARTHSADQVGQIAASIKEFGFNNPILCDGDNGVIAGHGRLMAAQKLGLNTVPVIELSHLSETQKRAYILADNKLAENAGWDDALVQVELEVLSAEGFDVELTGFDYEELPKGCGGALTDPDEVPDVTSEEPTVTAGDLWLLGNHRLLCGDSTDVVQVERLMGGKKADMVWTDPPYNVAYKTKAGSIANDDLSDDDFYNFLLKIYKNYFLVLKEGGCIYVAHADSEGLNFRKAFIDSELSLRQNLIWVKNAATLSRSDYNWQHEPILYGWKPGAGHWFCKNFKLTTVIDDTVDIDTLDRDELISILKKIKEEQESTSIWENKPKRSELHPTMKPVKLVSRFIRSSSKKNQVVVDFFGGSGSTLIACEQEGRCNYSMELDPHYCDVIIKRWEGYTGQKAVLDGR